MAKEIGDEVRFGTIVPKVKREVSTAVLLN